MFHPLNSHRAKQNEPEGFKLKDGLNISDLLLVDLMYFITNHRVPRGVNQTLNFSFEMFKI